MQPITFESLETRSLMSAGLHHATLHIEGTKNADTIVVRADATNLIVERNGESKSFKLSKVRRIVIDGGKGNDLLAVDDADGLFSMPVTLIGGKGSDYLDGGSGNDLLIGGPGDDFMYGHSGNDTLFGCDGNDLVIGDAGNDYVLGDRGNDIVGGGEGDDVVIGGEGVDQVYGEAGADKFSPIDSVTERNMDDLDTLISARKK